MNRSNQTPVFDCRQCGECCRGDKGILVTPEETAALADFLGFSPAEVASRYLITSPLGPQVAARNGACIFLVNNRCGVHPVKPRICREWPFLPALLAHADEFEAAKEACPGLAPACRHEAFVVAAGRQGP